MAMAIWDVLSSGKWYENTDGLGTFGTPQVIYDAVRASRAADIDGDGDPDVLDLGSSAVWYENIDGLGGFGPPRSVGGPTGRYHTWGPVTDFDRDGDLDVLLVVDDPVDGSPNSSVTWHENTNGLGDFGAHVFGSWEEQEPLPAELRFERLAYAEAEDLDGDNDLDLIFVAVQSEEGSLGIYPNWFENTDGLGTLEFKQRIPCHGQDPRSLRFADLDNDGDVDVLSASGTHHKSEVIWCENTGFDNCPDDYNPSQTDTDANGLGRRLQFGRRRRRRRMGG